MKTYSEKLKDPKWQKRRLEILQRQSFKCEECQDDKEELHVHHRFYKKGASPWDYEDCDLQCLCKTCHAIRQIHLDKVYRNIGLFNNEQLELMIRYIMPVMDSTPWSIEMLSRFFHGLESDFKMKHGIEQL